MSWDGDRDVVVTNKYTMPDGKPCIKASLEAIGRASSDGDSLLDALREFDYGGRTEVMKEMIKYGWTEERHHDFVARLRGVAGPYLPFPPFGPEAEMTRSAVTVLARHPWIIDDELKDRPASKKAYEEVLLQAMARSSFDYTTWWAKMTPLSQNELQRNHVRHIKNWDSNISSSLMTHLDKVGAEWMKKNPLHRGSVASMSMDEIVKATVDDLDIDSVSMPGSRSQVIVAGRDSVLEAVEMKADKLQLQELEAVWRRLRRGDAEQPTAAEMGTTADLWDQYRGRILTYISGKREPTLTEDQIEKMTGEFAQRLKKRISEEKVRNDLDAQNRFEEEARKREHAAHMARQAEEHRKKEEDACLARELKELEADMELSAMNPNFSEF